VGEVIVHSSGPAADNRYIFAKLECQFIDKKGACVIARMRGATEWLSRVKNRGVRPAGAVQSTCLIRSPERLGEFSQEVRLDDESEIINTPVLLA
jgi:hypothetical protein